MAYVKWTYDVRQWKEGACRILMKEYIWRSVWVSKLAHVILSPAQRSLPFVSYLSDFFLYLHSFFVFCWWKFKLDFFGSTWKKLVEYTTKEVQTTKKLGNLFLSNVIDSLYIFSHFPKCEMLTFILLWLTPVKRSGNSEIKPSLFTNN